jgi:hypothetical protein
VAYITNMYEGTLWTATRHASTKEFEGDQADDFARARLLCLPMPHEKLVQVIGEKLAVARAERSRAAE